eukprot:gnl/Ergobibamus_cyprinoides/186.p1 GENE.gnl/Ergobibamus_cyprinoides/186~~gnl/Ergobibamus_cyprinoides/186.p1  ORF type:complete len:356 (+),score=99.74 gnl/Ergobibamus_cyprinoides/186:221-1288(+)
MSSLPRAPATPQFFAVERVIAIGRMHKADFIVAIGGGSPIDLAKAVGGRGVLQSHSLFSPTVTAVAPDAPHVPLVAIPTTAGTGTEATPYSILTRPAPDGHGVEKFGFSGRVFPTLSLLCPAFFATLPARIAIDTVVDAFSHLAEGVLCTKATDATDGPAFAGIALIAKHLHLLRAAAASIEADSDEAYNPVCGLGDAEWRDLIAASTLGGAVIAHTSTSLPHGAGYGLTTHCDPSIPHGRANGLLFPPFCELVARAGPVWAAKVARVEATFLGQCAASATDFAVAPPAAAVIHAQFSSLMRELVGPSVAVPAEVMDAVLIPRFAENKAKLAQYPGELTAEDLRFLFSFGVVVKD